MPPRRPTDPRPEDRERMRPKYPPAFDSKEYWELRARDIEIALREEIERVKKELEVVKIQRDDFRNRSDDSYAALQDALEGLEDMFPYVPEYFQEKWGHQGYIDRAREILRKLDAP